MPLRARRPAIRRPGDGPQIRGRYDDGQRSEAKRPGSEETQGRQEQEEGSRRGARSLRAAAQVYGVDTDAVALKVKQEFAAREKAKKASKPEPKPALKAKRVP